MLGLAAGAVVLVEHDSGWAAAYGEEERRIMSALGGLALDVQHCGSTAVPGLRAKPILDILVGVGQWASGHECIQQLRGMGYDYLGMEVVPDEHFFSKGNPCTHHLHLVEWLGLRWREMTFFRDCLLADQETAMRYEALKEALASRFPNDRASYTREKAAFIVDVVVAGSMPGRLG